MSSHGIEKDYNKEYKLKSSHSSPKYRKLECHRGDQNNEPLVSSSPMLQTNKQISVSDSEYESIGETINENEDFYDSDTIPIVGYHNNSCSNAQISIKQPQNLLTGNNVTDVFSPDKNKKQKSPCNGPFKCTTKNKDVFQASGNKASSCATLSPTNRYSKRMGTKEPGKLANNCEKNEVIVKFSNGLTHISPHKDPQPRKAYSPAVRASSSIEGNKRSEGKRETWVTKSKMSALHDAMSTSLRKSKEVEILAKDTKSKQRRSSTEYLKDHVNKIKDLQIRLTRLRGSTLNQYKCVQSLSPSSHPSPSSSRGRISKSPYNKDRVRRNSIKSYTSQPSFYEKLKSGAQEVSNNDNISKRATKTRKLSNLSDPGNTDTRNNYDNVYNLAKQSPSQFYPFKTPPLDSSATTVSSHSTPSSPEGIKLDGTKSVAGT